MKNKNLRLMLAAGAAAVLAVQSGGGGTVLVTGIELRGGPQVAACGEGTEGMQVTVRGEGAAGKGYDLMRSDTLGTGADWEPVGHATAEADGAFSFDVRDGEAKASAFYRVAEAAAAKGKKTARNGEEPEDPTEDPTEDPPDDVLDVCDFGAVANDGADDSGAFRSALAAARDNAIELGKEVEVHVPAGTYHLASNVPIYSNTKLLAATNATIVNTDTGGAGVMVFGAHLDGNGWLCGLAEDCPHGGYSQFENITIEGGTWNANDGGGQGNHLVFQFRHGRNIAIRNLTCRNAANHFLNLSGTDNAAVENVTCENAATYTGDDPDFWGVYKNSRDSRRYATLEAVHTDYLDPAGEGKAYPLDGTPSQNIRISGCTFRNVYAGVGAHNYSVQGLHAGNVSVLDSTFEIKEGEGNCVNLFGFTNATVRGNTATAANKAKEFLNCMGSSATVGNNRILGFSAIAIYLGEGSEASISGNRISGGPNGICVTGGSNAGEIRGNTVSRMGDTAVKVDQSSAGSIQSNRISGAKGPGIRIAQSAVALVQGNGIDCTGAAAGTHGIFVTGGSGIAIQGNQVTNAPACGIMADGTANAVISGNSVRKAGQNGIVANACSKPAVNGNTVVSPGKHGIFLYRSDNGTVSGNTVKSAKEIGMAVIACAKAVIQGNKVSDSKGHGIYAAGEKARKTSATLEGNASVSGSTAAGTADIRFGEYCTGCVAKNNTVGTRGLAAHSSAKYTETGTRISLGRCTVALSATTLYYEGKAVKPKITVKCKSTTLKNGTDYTLSWKNNNGYGTATVTIAGKGKYAGKVAKDFKILLKAPVPNSVKEVKNGVKLVWTGSKGAAKYRVFRKTGSGKFAKLADTTATGFVDKTVKSGKTYTYTVRCLSADGKAYTSPYDKKGLPVKYKK